MTKGYPTLEEYEAAARHFTGPEGAAARLVAAWLTGTGLRLDAEEVAMLSSVSCVMDRAEVLVYRLRQRARGEP